MEDWKGGRVEGWKSGRMEDWKGGRVEGWKSGWMNGVCESGRRYGQEEYKSRVSEAQGLGRCDSVLHSYLRSILWFSFCIAASRVTADFTRGCYSPEHRGRVLPPVNKRIS